MTLDPLKLLGFLWPPKADADPTTWRFAMFFAHLGVLAVLTFHIAASAGILSRFGISGYATDKEVEQLDRKQDAILFALYAPQVRTLIRDRCETSDRYEREEINQRLVIILREYYELTGTNFSPIPTCNEV